MHIDYRVVEIYSKRLSRFVRLKKFEKADKEKLFSPLTEFKSEKDYMEYVIALVLEDNNSSTKTQDALEELYKLCIRANPFLSMNAYERTLSKGKLEIFKSDACKLDYKQLLNRLEERIVGQADALKGIADYIKGMWLVSECPRLHFYGPKGTGKSLTARNLAELLFEEHPVLPTPKVLKERKLCFLERPSKDSLEKLLSYIRCISRDMQCIIVIESRNQIKELTNDNFYHVRFKHLEKKDFNKILQIEMAKIKKRLQRRGITFKISKSALLLILNAMKKYKEANIAKNIIYHEILPRIDPNASLAFCCASGNSIMIKNKYE